MSLEEEVGYEPSLEVLLDERTTNRKTCLLCETSVSSHLRRHFYSVHAPWYLCPYRACWVCEYPVKSFSRHIATMTRQHENTNPCFNDSRLPLWCQLVYGFLLSVSHRLGLSDLADLLSFVVNNSLFPLYVTNQECFNLSEIATLKALLTSLSLPIPDSFTISPPNCVASLLHWQILSCVFATLPSDELPELTDFSLPLSVPKELTLNNPSYIDSHCHLDKLLRSTGFRSFHDLQAALSPGLVDIYYCISNCVFPSLWSLARTRLAGLPTVRCTIGVHPHLVTPGGEARMVGRISAALETGDFVGIGEVGLDFTTACRCKPACPNKGQCREIKIQSQRTFLREVLQLARNGDQTLVLHCRDHGAGDAAEEVRLLLIELGLQHLRIHRHCFVGDVAELERWLWSFPNAMFGFTNTILSDTAASQVLLRVPMDKILLETDSPYLPVKQGRINTPWHIGTVAGRIAEIKNLPLHLIRLTCNNNAAHLYKL